MERALDLAIRFVVGVWVVRYLGPAQFGVYTYALSFIVLFTALAGLGLDQIIVRNLVRSQQVGTLLWTAFVMRLAAAIVLLAMIVPLVQLTEPDPLLRLAVFLVSGQLVFQAANVFDFWFQATLQSKYAVWVRTSVTVVISGSQIVCILAGMPLSAFLLLVLLQSVLVTIGLFVSFRLVGPTPVTWHFSWQEARALMRDAWPLMLAGLSIMVYMRIDQIMLGKILGPTVLGIYGAAVRVSELWYFLPVALAGSVFPALVRMREDVSADVYARRMQAFYDGMALLSYAVIIPLTLLAKPIILLLYGQPFAEATSILQVHIWAFLFVSLGVARSKWLVAENRTFFSMASTMLGAVTNVALNLVWIPTFAGLGAAWATLVSYALAVLVTNVFFSRYLHVAHQMTRALFAPVRLLWRLTQSLRTSL